MESLAYRKAQRHTEWFNLHYGAARFVDNGSDDWALTLATGGWSENEYVLMPDARDDRETFKSALALQQCMHMTLRGGLHVFGKGPAVHAALDDEIRRYKERML